MSIRIELPSVKIGITEAADAHVELVNASLAHEMDEACERIRRTHSVESLAEYEPIRAVRAMFRAWDMDPSKYRPSSEALLRRVVQGKGLYRVRTLSTPAILAQSKRAGHTAATIATKSPEPLFFGTVAQVSATKELEKECGTWRVALYWRTIRVPLAVPSAIRRAP